ncbi:MAG: hypothetical protein MJ238_03790 [Bacilli bacterium]|nr:hypothetical protein [Bacilli bacterium]
MISGGKKFSYRYSIYAFSLKKLIHFGVIRDNGLFVKDADVCRCFQNPYEQFESKPDSIMFYQARLAMERYDGDPIYANESCDSLDFVHDFITIDFTDAFEQYESVKAIQYIMMKVPGAEKQCRFEYFLKSNSMSKDSKVLYINADTCKNGSGHDRYLMNTLNKRLKFDLLRQEERFTLSKWFAYSGLALSDVEFVDELLINEENSIVIKDFKKVHMTKCITAVSLQSLNADVRKSHELMGRGDYNEKNAFLKLKCFAKSKDAKQLANAGSERKGANDVLDALNLIASFVEEADLNKRQSITEDNWIKWGKLPCIEKINIEAKYQLSDPVISWFEIESDPNYPFPHEINAFDGEGLISERMADKINEKLKKAGIEKEDHYSFQVRLPFIKGNLHACDFHRYFKDHKLTTIKGIRIFESNQFEEYPIDKIDFIFTESQVKMAALAKNLDREKKGCDNLWKKYVGLLKEYDHKFAITSFEPIQDEPARLNIEFFATLPLTTDDYDRIIQESKDILDESLEDRKLLGNLRGNEKDICEANEQFFKSTSRYKEIHADEYSSFVKDSLQLKLPVKKSRRMFLSSDLMMLLNHASNLKDHSRPPKPDDSLHRIKDGELAVYQCYIPGWHDTEDPVFCPGKRVMILRNPHYARNEISILKSAPEDDLRKRYFSKLKGVIWLNPYSLHAERLGGADYDGDEVVVVGDDLLVNSVFEKIKKKKNDTSMYPTVLIPSLKDENPHVYNHQNIIDCFRRTFSSEVGRISNEALRVAEYAYNRPLPDNLSDLEKISAQTTRSNFVAFYTILGGISIDAAKKGYKPVFVPASSFTHDSKALIKQEYTSSRYIEFKDAIKSMKYFKTDSNKFKTVDGGEKKSPLDIKYENLIKSKADDTFWAKYLINRIKDWDYVKPETKGEAVRQDKDNYHNSLVALKALAVRSIVFSFLSFVKEFDEKRQLQQGTIVSVMADTDTTSSDYSSRTGEMIDAIMDCDISGADLLEKYCESPTPFHYLANDNEKDGFMVYTLGLEKAKFSTAWDHFKDFSNGGYKNLYLAIKYKEIAERMNPMNVYPIFPDSVDDIKEGWEWIHKKGIIDSQQFESHVSAIASEINDEAKVFINRYIDPGRWYGPAKAFRKHVDKGLKKWISENSTGITLEQVQYVVGVKNNDAVMERFQDAFIKYLKKEKEQND